MDPSLIQHKDLAAGRWTQLSLFEQLGNVGSEVGRALNWRNKQRPEKSYQSFVRALELIDLTLACKHPLHRLREVGRAREVLADFFAGDNKINTKHPHPNDNIN